MIKNIFDNTLLILAILVAFTSIFVFNSTNVEGISMESSLHNQDKLITQIISRDFGREDIVILFSDNLGQGFFIPNLVNTLYQVNNNKRVIYVKRIVGLPGESIEMKNKEIIVYNKDNPNGYKLQEKYTKNDWKCKDTNNFEVISNLAYNFKKTLVENDSYFVMGDNRGCSKDSRIIGQIKKDSIIGKVIHKLSK